MRARGRGVGAGDINSRSIGIELQNDGRSPFRERQMAALERLLSGRDGPLGYCSREASSRIPTCRPIARVTRVPRFDWRRLARSGLSVWPRTRCGPPGDFRGGRAGLRVPPGVGEDLLLASLRLRFRPWASGPLGDADRAIAAGLATALAR
jgi:N-acetylmuramoyl-L-alanine amidase